MTAEEALRQAEAEGLTLLRSRRNASGYRFVSMHGWQAASERVCGCRLFSFLSLSLHALALDSRASPIGTFESTAMWVGVQA